LVAIATEPDAGILADPSPRSFTACIPTATTNTDFLHPRPLFLPTGSEPRLFVAGPIRTILTAANGGRGEKRDYLSGSEPHLLSADPSRSACAPANCGSGRRSELYTTADLTQAACCASMAGGIRVLDRPGSYNLP
jgi:hypothetical protein